MFEAHGRHLIQISNNVLRIDAFDAWNEQHTKAFINQVEVEIDTKLRDKRWAVLVVMHSWLPTTDSLSMLQDITEYAISVGMRFEAFTGDSALSASVLTNKILPPDSDIYQKAQFASEQEALDWLSASLDQFE